MKEFHSEFVRIDDLGPEYRFYRLGQGEDGHWFIEIEHSALNPDYLSDAVRWRESIEEFRGHHKETSEIRIKMEETLAELLRGMRPGQPPIDHA